MYLPSAGVFSDSGARGDRGRRLHRRLDADPAERHSCTRGTCRVGPLSGPAVTFRHTTFGACCSPARTLRTPDPAHKPDADAPGRRRASPSSPLRRRPRARRHRARGVRKATDLFFLTPEEAAMFVAEWLRARGADVCRTGRRLRVTMSRSVGGRDDYDGHSYDSLWTDALLPKVHAIKRNADIKRSKPKRIVSTALRDSLKLGRAEAARPRSVRAIS